MKTISKSFAFQLPFSIFDLGWGPQKAKNFLGTIQLKSPFSTFCKNEDGDKVNNISFSSTFFFKCILFVFKIHPFLLLFPSLNYFIFIFLFSSYINIFFIILISNFLFFLSLLSLSLNSFSHFIFLLFCFLKFYYPFFVSFRQKNIYLFLSNKLLTTTTHRISFNKCYYIIL